MKKFIVIVLLLLLIGGGGAAGWFYYMGQEGAASAPPAPVYSHIELDNIPVTRIKNGVADQLFYFQIVLSIDDPEKEAKVRAVMPAIVDALIVELHWLLARKIMAQNDFDQDLIRMRLEKAVNRRIGPGWIQRLNIRNIDRVELR